ncbi:MAG TPA: Uma2 family endonuclease [Tepidisphaeraceae bacterium]|nr:Uma2 family endonuclease [Tepidisphaeraceae bacterium]
MDLPKRGQRYTPEEYYRLERAAEFKSDYYQGAISAMSGGTIRHSLITANLVGEIGQRLKGKPCTVFESNLRMRIKATGLRTYPDASVYRDPPERDAEDSAGETLTNPTVLFEVLSKSTEAYDRGLKSENYRRIESLRAYVLVSQNAPHAEVYERQADARWLLNEARGLDAVLTIAAIGVELRLEDLYYRVDFNAPDGD